MSVYASRRIPDPDYLGRVVRHISSVAPYRVPLEPGQCLEKARDYWPRGYQLVMTGRARNPPAWRPAVDAVLARVEAGTSELLDVDGEAATVALELCPVFAAMPLWLAAGGLVFALRALVRSHHIASWARLHGFADETGTWIVEETRSYQRPEYADTAWQLLRAALAEANDETYAEARTIAEAARREDPVLATWIAFAFPDESTWWEEAMPDALRVASQAHRKRYYLPALARLVSVAPIEAAHALVSAAGNQALVEDDLFTLIAHRGPSASTVVAAALATAPNADARKRVSRVQKALAGPAARKTRATATTTGKRTRASR